MRGCRLDCHIRGCHGGTITMSLSYAPTRQFSAAIVILREAFRVYSHISRERPGSWCGWTVIELSSTLRVCPALVCPGAYPVKLLPLELHPHNRARPQATVHRRGAGSSPPWVGQGIAASPGRFIAAPPTQGRGVPLDQPGRGGNCKSRRGRIRRVVACTPHLTGWPLFPAYIYPSLCKLRSESKPPG